MRSGKLKLLSRLVDVVLPPVCAGCGTEVDQPQTLCASCWSKLTFLGRPSCEACAHPFEYEVPDQTLCGACVREHPVFDRGRAALIYDDHTRDFVLGFKHADRTEMAELFSKWMIAAGRELVEDCDVIVPVPLHWTRLFARRYNQAALLAHGVGKLSAKPIWPDILVRKRNTRLKVTWGVELGLETYRVLLRFTVKNRIKINGKRVLLIDDVLTTGATLQATARVLKRAGATSVDVLVLARVVRDFA